MFDENENEKRQNPPEPNQSAYKEGDSLGQKGPGSAGPTGMEGSPPFGGEQRPIERPTGGRNGGARGTAAMDPATRQEVARKGGLAVSRNRQHMAEIGRKGGQSVSKNRDHMANIGRKGGSASRTGGHS